MRRVLLDQGLPAPAAAVLRNNDWDAVHVREIAMSQATDAEILDYAARESRVLITLDRDFSQILALTSAARPSVVLYPPATIAGARTCGTHGCDLARP